MTSISNPKAIRAMQLRTAIRGIELEAIGMKRRGASLTSLYRTHYALPRGTSRDALIARIRQDIDAIDREILHNADGEPSQ